MKKIKKEDLPLFEQLEAGAYSSWGLVPKDERKLSFAVVFSVFYLFVSWLTVKVIIGLL